MDQTSFHSIRPVRPEDLTILQSIITANEMFPPEMLPDMMSAFFAGDAAGEFWVTYEKDDTPVSVAYFAPERMTEGTDNLYLIAVHPDQHSRGIGQEMMHYIESFLREKSVRILLVETSGLAEFERTRSFYHQNGYSLEATVREFYTKGEDKIIFWKKLAKDE